MAWNMLWTLVVRGHDTVDDPEAEGYVEARYQVREVVPVRAPVGEVRKFVGDVTKGPRLRVRHFKVRPSPVTTLAQLTTSELQDWGAYEQADYVLTREYVYLYQYLLNGSNPGLGPAPRAARHEADEDGADTLWSSLLPVAVECTDGIGEPQYVTGGRYEWDHMLVARVPMARS